MPTRTCGTVYDVTEELCAAAGLEVVRMSTMRSRAAKPAQSRLLALRRYVGVGPGPHGRLTLEGRAWPRADGCRRSGSPRWRRTEPASHAPTFPQLRARESAHGFAPREGSPPAYRERVGSRAATARVVELSGGLVATGNGRRARRPVAVSCSTPSSRKWLKA